MKMTAKFEAEGESFNACFEQLNSAFNAEFSASGGGQDGKDGATFTPSVSEDGVISWTNDRELPNPAPVNIKGEKGDKGDTGANGKNGTNGVDGKDGKDGFSPVVAVDDIENGHRVTITDKDGAKSFDVMDGKDGQGGGGVASWNDLTDKPDFAPIATSGSWNDLTDKPFGDESHEPIVWDGNTEGLEADPIIGQMYKISETGVRKDELIGATLRGYSPSSGKEKSGILGDATILDVGELNPLLPLDTMYMDGAGAYFLTVAADFIFNGVTMKRGFYASKDFISLTFPEKVKLLDEKFLPESVVLESELTAKGYQTEEQVTALIEQAIANLPRYNGEVEEI